MATYKLMQDIEAEDKILGPLTLRQFVFALLTLFIGWMAFLAIQKGLFIFLILLAPPFFLGAFFAFPFGRDQPTEVWALAKIRFLFKPRKRLWDQSGVKELVTITAPKKIERSYTNGLSQSEVQSRLKALANTIDSRGWAVKNVNLTDYTPNPMATFSSDRLIDMNSVPQAVPDASVSASDDMLDAQNNPIAQQFETMINRSSNSHRQALMDKMNAPAQPNPAPTNNQWFMGGSPTTEEAALLARKRAENDARQVSYGHLHTLQPITSPVSQGVQTPAVAAPAASTTPVSQPNPTAMTDQPDPAILSLATNDDLNVATLAREAQKAKESGDASSEVVVSLR